MTGGELKEEKTEPVKAVLPLIKKEASLAATKIEKKKVKKAKIAVVPKKQLEAKIPKKTVKKPTVKKPVIKERPVTFVPVVESPAAPLPVVDQKKMDVIQLPHEPAKKMIRRSALEIKKAEEMQEKRKIDQEKEWEIPAFLRRVKFK